MKLNQRTLMILLGIAAAILLAGIIMLIVHYM